MIKKFWNWTDKADGGELTRTLTIDGTIAEESWFDDDVTPAVFREELESGSGDIEVYINSPGGDCIAASQIYTMLMEYQGNVTVKVDGMAASAASVIAMAGTEVLMAPTSMMMIHNPMTLAMGNSDDMQKAIDMLDEVKESIINAYELKTGLSRNKISRLMDDETWMNAKKAMELGFADGMVGDETVVALIDNAYSYSAAAVVQNITNKIKSKNAETQKDGARVLDLKKALYDKIVNS